MFKKYMKSKGYKDYTVEKVLRYDGCYAFKDPKKNKLLAEGLQKAGLPLK